MKFSIVIPMYNAVDTIGRALESVKKQIYTDYEVIVVDDGSEQRRDIEADVYIYQRNKGAGAARNRGLMNAKGEYVIFLDADDELINENVLYALARDVQGYDAIYGLANEQGNGYITQRNPREIGSVWGVAYKREFIKDIRFPEIPQMEDVAFNQIVENSGGTWKTVDYATYIYHVENREGKERYRVTALPWIVKSNEYVLNYFKDKGLAYTLGQNTVKFILDYWLNVKDQLTEKESSDFIEALTHWMAN